MAKRIGFCVMSFFIVSIGLFGQAGPTPPSSTNLSTGAIFMQDNDLYLSPLDFSQLTSNVLFLQFAVPGDADNQLKFGTGLFLGNLYVGGYYGMTLETKSGNLVVGPDSNFSTITNVNDTLLLSGTNIVGTQQVRTDRTDYSANTLNDVRLIFGIKQLGPLTLGLFDRFLQSNASRYGSFGVTIPTQTYASWTDWTTTPWVTAGTQTATTTTISDAAGNLQSLISEAYGPGVQTDTVIENEFQAGALLPLANLLLRFSASFDFSINGSGSSGSREYYTRQVNTTNPYPAYTPTTALPGATAAAIPDLMGYDFQSANAALNDTDITATAGVAADLPIGETIVLRPRLDYRLSTPAYSNSYFDTSGTEQTVAGMAWDLHRLNYAVATDANTGLLGTTTTETRIYETAAYSAVQNGVSPSIRIIVTPNALFSFGVMYQPSFTFGSASSSLTRNSLVTTTHNDGTGPTGAFSYVQTDAVSIAGENGTQSSFSLSHSLSAGARFFLIPDKLRVNLGFDVSQILYDETAYQRTTTGIATELSQIAYSGSATPTTIAYDVNPNATTTVPAFFNNTQESAQAVSYAARGGLTFFFSSDMSIDLIASLNPSALASGGNLFSLDTWSAEMTIRY